MGLLFHCSSTVFAGLDIRDMDVANGYGGSIELEMMCVFHLIADGGQIFDKFWGNY